jgi:hypothetical protein
MPFTHLPAKGLTLPAPRCISDRRSLIMGTSGHTVTYPAWFNPASGENWILAHPHFSSWFSFTGLSISF